MSVYYLKFNYPGWGNLYHKVEAANQHEAIEKFIRRTSVPASKVKVWKGRGLPKHLAGRNA